MKILVAFTGGTIGSVRSKSGIGTNADATKSLIDMYEKSGGKAELVTVQPYNILSENLSGKNLFVLYECISSRLDDEVDGVVVTCGTDTLQYTCAYLSYSFGLCSKPIVAVSANYPLEDKRSNGWANFCAAVDFVENNRGNGVFAAYQNDGETTKLHRASRLLPHLPYSDRAESVLNSVYGEYSDGCFVPNLSFSQREDSDEFLPKLDLGESSRVLYVQPTVGMSYPILTDKTKAVLLATYHSGTLNTADGRLKEFCTFAKSSGVPVFLTGEAEGFEYESKNALRELDVHILPTASPVAMYVKLWLTGGRAEDMYKPFGGDFIGE